MSLFSRRTDIGTHHYHSLWRFFWLLLLLTSLPLFIWAVLTQRIELRKRASTSEPTQICWNRVMPSTEGNALWPNSCKGNPRTDLACTQIRMSLTNEEVGQYKNWLTIGRPYIPGCSMTPPTPSPSINRINWRTPYAFLEAQDLTITANGKIFKGNPDPGTTVNINSDPGSSEYTTLEAIWREQGVEMRLFIYFYAEYQKLNGARQWGYTEIRTYNGNSSGDWIYYKNKTSLAAIGSASPSLGEGPTIWSDPNGSLKGEISISGMRMQAFLNQKPTPPPVRLCLACDANNQCPSGLTCQAIRQGPGGCQADGSGRTICYDPAIKMVCAPPNNPNVCIPTRTPICIPRPPCMDAPADPNCQFAGAWEPLPPGATYCRPTPTPACIPLPECVYNPPIVNGKPIPCDVAMQAGVVYCPHTTPTCTPLPRCATEGMIGPNGERVFCALDPLPGMTYCPKPTPAQKPGDLNNDGKVNIFDYNLLLAQFDKTGKPGFHPADINKDGKINIFDYNMILKYFE